MALNRFGAWRKPRAGGLVVAAAAVVLATYGLGAVSPLPARPAGPATATPTRTPDAAGGPGAASGIADPFEATSGPVGPDLAVIDRSIRTWTGNLRRDAKDFLAATTLATLYGARARLTADVDDYDRARQAAETAVAAAPDYAPARLAEATALLALHDFSAARDVASELYREDHDQLVALAAVGDASQELGDYAAARAAFDAVAAATSGPAVDARLARLAYLTGNDASARSLAIRARDEAAAADPAGDPIGAVFYHYQLAELARLTGDAALAGSGYEAALAIRPTDLGSLVGLAKVRAFEGRTADAIALLRRATAIAPQPEALGLLGDLLADSGDTTGAARAWATVRLVRRLSDVAGAVYDRQLLQFELDHGGTNGDILSRARASLATRHDAYGHDVVAWALYRLGRYAEAAMEAAAARANGIVDARILFHAGAIALANGDGGGTELVRQALALGPALDPRERAEAVSLLR